MDQYVYISSASNTCKPLGCHMDAIMGFSTTSLANLGFHCSRGDTNNDQHWVWADPQVGNSRVGIELNLTHMSKSFIMRLYLTPISRQHRPPETPESSVECCPADATSAHYVDTMIHSVCHSDVKSAQIKFSDMLPMYKISPDLHQYTGISAHSRILSTARSMG